MNIRQNQLGSFVVFLVVLAVMGLSLLVTGYMYSKFIPLAGNVTMIQNSTLYAPITHQMGSIFSIFDKATFLIYIGLVIAMIITNWYIPTSPIFMYINIFGMLIVLAVSPVISNIYGQLLENAEISTVAATFPINHYLMVNLPIFILIAIVINTVVLYAKGQQQQMGSTPYG